MMSMREVFGKTLCQLGTDPRLVVLDADVSSSTQTILFKQAYPDRFYNFGIAEADMVAAAAGMATFGLIPVVSSFAFLLALRAGDPVHSLIAYNGLNVKLAGGYAGLSDHADGASHQAVTDLAVMRSLPNMTVFAPSDIESTQQAVRAAVTMDGPVYIRLSRHTVGSIHAADYAFRPGHADVLTDGRDVTLVVTGAMTDMTLAAARQLASQNISAAVVEYTTLKPFDVDTLLPLAAKTRRIITIEEHSVIGGLGGAVCEALAETCPTPVRRIGLQDCFGESSRDYDSLLAARGLSVRNIAETAEKFVKGNKS